MRKPFDLTFIPFPSATLHVDSYLLLCLVKDAHSVQASKSPTRLFTGWFQRDRGRCNRYPPNQRPRQPLRTIRFPRFKTFTLITPYYSSLSSLGSSLLLLPFFLVFFNIRIQRRIILRNRLAIDITKSILFLSFHLFINDIGRLFRNIEYHLVASNRCIVIVRERNLQRDAYENTRC